MGGIIIIATIYFLVLCVITYIYHKKRVKSEKEWITLVVHALHIGADFGFKNSSKFKSAKELHDHMYTEIMETEELKEGFDN